MNRRFATLPLAHLPLPAMLPKAWGQVQHELLYLTWGLMEVALVTPFALSFMRWARYWPPGQVLLWLWLLMLLPFNLARLLSRLQVRPTHQQTIMASGLLLMLFISIRTLLYEPRSLLDFNWLAGFFINALTINSSAWLRDLSLFLLIVLMWWRGIRLVNRIFDIDQIGLRLRIGALLLAPFIIWFGYQRLIWDMTPYIFLFFLAGLTVVSLVRAEQLEKGRSGRSVSLSPRWFSGILATSLFIVLISGFLAILITGQSAEVLIGWLAPLWTALYFSAAIIIHTVGHVVGYVIQPFFFLIDAAFALLATVMGVLVRFLERVSDLFRGSPLLELLDSLQSLAGRETIQLGRATVGFKASLLLLMLALVLVVSLALRRLYRQTELAQRLSRLTTGTDADESGDRSFGRRFLQRLGLLSRWHTAASIRRLYRQMNRAAAAVGYPRGESQTPYEYLETLALAWPENTADSASITQAYVKIRYGQLPETKEELAQLTAAWKRLEKAGPAI